MTDDAKYGKVGFSLLFWACGGVDSLIAQGSPEGIARWLQGRAAVFSRTIAAFNGEVVSDYFEPMLAVWEEERPVSQAVFDAARELLKVGGEQGWAASALVSHGQCVYRRQGGKTVAYGDSLNRAMRLSDDLTRRRVGLGVDSLVIEDCPWAEAATRHGDIYEIGS